MIFQLLYAEKNINENELKAAYIERFSRFIDWPSVTEVENPNQPFILGVVGDKKFSKTLEDIFENQQIKNKKVIVKYLIGNEDLSSFHLLFISGYAESKLEKILNQIQGKPILTIGDTPGFAQKGVNINLFFSNNQLRFEINDKSLKDHSLKASHLLLNQAKIIN